MSKWWNELHITLLIAVFLAGWCQVNEIAESRVTSAIGASNSMHILGVRMLDTGTHGRNIFHSHSCKSDVDWSNHSNWAYDSPSSGLGSPAEEVVFSRLFSKSLTFIQNSSLLSLCYVPFIYGEVICPVSFPMLQHSKQERVWTSEAFWWRVDTYGTFLPNFLSWIILLKSDSKDFKIQNLNQNYCFPNIFIVCVLCVGF